MTSRLMWNGNYVLDGGVVDNVPVCALDGAPGVTLVLLTRRYPALPDVPGRTYVQPSRKIPVSAWDYTNADGLQVAYDLGRRDGEAFLESRCTARGLRLGDRDEGSLKRRFRTDQSAFGIPGPSTRPCPAWQLAQPPISSP